MQEAAVLGRFFDADCLCMNNYTCIFQGVWLPSWVCFAADLCDQGPVKLEFQILSVAHLNFLFSLKSLIGMTRFQHPWGIQQRSLLNPAELQGFSAKTIGLLSLLSDKSVMWNKSVYLLGPLWPRSLPTTMSPFTTVVWKVLYSKDTKPEIWDVAKNYHATSVQSHTLTLYVQ